MSQFLLKTILYGCRTVRTSPKISHLGFLGDPNGIVLRWISSSSNQQSFTVSYLKNSLGLSSQAALSVSKYVKFDSPEKPDKVIKFFEDRGFTMTQISCLVRAFPRVFSYNTHENILPKLEFFESKGISGPEIAKMVSLFPTVLARSLHNQILPSYDYMRGLFQSEEKLIRAIKRCPDILRYNIEKNFSPKIDILREHGVPDSNIATLMLNWSKTFMVSRDSFRKTAQKVEDMGFDASKVKFVLAVVAFWTMDESKWQSKIKAYKKWGWSEDEILKAFKKSPWCMMVSEDKLMASMDFLINQMGWKPCLMAEYPVIFTVSLKKRIVPRCSVFQYLLSEGLVEKEVSIGTLLKVPEEKFLQKFIAPYVKKAPKLLKLYREKLDLSSGSESDENVPFNNGIP
ncbi:transcription termination factor MTERF9, chloroplastic [Morus notabilis]|uniref:transcription termination factor MTERF9, chloroplastic n=1 Tax=Morus notabilis TaxID=981085 RepID=UPI000CED4861|nr:transcription termination factor MTERF9, chloroplastic [Morus notabilis]